MKNSIAVIAGLAIILFTSSFTTANPETETAHVTAVFQKEFANASNVSWKENGNLYFADFEFNGKPMSAAYNSNGMLLGTSRIISKTAVPAELLKRVEGNFRNGKAAPYVLELTMDGKTSYYFDVITKASVIKCNADADGVITEDSRLKLQQ